MKKITALALAVIVSSCSTSTDYKIDILNKPCVSPLYKYNYITCDKLDVLINSEKVTVPKNFETDLASIPRFYWAIISPAKSDLMAASITHDYLYRCVTKYTRKESDNIFYYAMRSQNVSLYTSYKMYLAVRIFGGKNYKPKSVCHDVN